ncbi:MGMT family protein [Candidatus Woesearchaeota archaeon]|nr:MGMT family protein [Candidatus Woesearchaeota archaeon]
MVTAFEQRVYDILLSVPAGRVTTYKELGKAIGKDGNIYRAIGQALHKNPFAPRVPCHRVVCADGSLGGFAQGSSAKISLLASEGVVVAHGKVIDFEEKVWRF